MTYKEPLIFIAGAAVGAAVTAFAMRRHCDIRINKEVEEARSAYNEKLSNLSMKNRNKPDISELVKSVLPDDVSTVVKNSEKGDYKKYATVTEDEPEDVVVKANDDIHIVSEEDYMYDGSYEKLTVIIYADGTLARDDDDDLLDIEDSIGSTGYDAAMHNPDPSDAVYIRNELSNIDYEVLTSEKTYTQQTGVYIGGEARD